MFKLLNVSQGAFNKSVNVPTTTSSSVKSLMDSYSATRRGLDSSYSTSTSHRSSDQRGAVQGGNYVWSLFVLQYYFFLLDINSFIHVNLNYYKIVYQLRKCLMLLTKSPNGHLEGTTVVLLNWHCSS